MEHTGTFGQWLQQGGDYVIYLAAIVVGFSTIAAALYKLWKKLVLPADEAKRLSQEGDEELHKRVDEIEELHEKCAEKFSNDFHSINQIRREQDKMADALAGLTEGVFLIIQHLVTNDHVQDMERWMINYAASAAKPKKSGDENA